MRINRMLHGRAAKSGFTLIELLVVIVLMSILSGMMTYALSSANEEARRKRSVGECQLFAQIVAQRVNEIQLDSLDLLERDRPNRNGATVEANVVNFDSTRERNRVLMLARRDLARLTMPQCRADLLFPPTRLQYRQWVSRTSPTSGTVKAVCAKVKPPAQWNAMRRLAGLRTSNEIDLAYQSYANNANEPTMDAWVDTVQFYLTNDDYWRSVSEILMRDPDDPRFGSLLPIPRVDTPSPIDGDEVWTREHEAAECLYLILSTTELFGERAIDKVHARSIANIDGDAVPEIVDAWGQPYVFMREPVGLRHPGMNNFDATPEDPANPEDYFPDSSEPFDILLADLRYDATMPAMQNQGPPRPGNIPTALPWPPLAAQRPMSLFPVVMSAGPDGEFGIRLTYDRDDSDWNFGSRHLSTAVMGIEPVPRELQPVVGAYRYPDPFYDLALVDPNYVGGGVPNAATNYLLGDDFGNAARARFGGGLGGPANLVNAAANQSFDAADNITSLDSIE